MPTNQLTARHKFTGGWATDFGQITEAVPDQIGQVEVPYAAEAKNIAWQLDGGFRKYGGTAKVNASAVGGGTEPIFGLFDYWRLGTGGSPVRKRIIHVDTVIMKDDNDGSFSNIKTGLEADKQPHYSTFDDFAIITSESNTDVPQSYDQTTLQDLAGSPPNFAFSVAHQNRQWAAGVPSNPSRLYYSKLLDPEDWTDALAGTAAGSIDIDPGDGDMITGIWSHRNELLVFKGPYRGSIHRITGSSDTGDNAFARKVLSYSVGAVWQNAITNFRSDLCFMHIDGSVRSLDSTSKFGDFDQASLSLPINEKYIRANFNHSKARNVWMANDAINGRVLTAIPIGSDNTNSIILVMDYRFDPVRWSYIDAYSVQSLSTFIDTNNLTNILIGGQDGFVRRTNQGARSIDGTGVIATDVKTPFMNYGTPFEFKTVVSGATAVTPKGGDTLNFEWKRDLRGYQSRTLTQSSGGAAMGEFVLGTDTLGTAQFTHLFFDLEEGGEFRWIQLRMRNEVAGDDLEVHSLALAFERGAQGTE